jgi:hypothetical protein
MMPPSNLVSINLRRGVMLIAVAHVMKKDLTYMKASGMPLQEISAFHNSQQWAQLIDRRDCTEYKLPRVPRCSKRGRSDYSWIRK